ncbi:hypothetical protein BDV98DRAFT_277597 [Pterulicium gracile]|uniref:Uncharacterized protein n=1 Tax=Pterulicium gracile TaxID=1884261 RepID=A0A5C3Q4K6_9AGAR|nr:hypothetical protein BDV98DRAFT_277597 [Pterula gracilis]
MNFSLSSLPSPLLRSTCPRQHSSTLQNEPPPSLPAGSSHAVLSSTCCSQHTTRLTELDGVSSITTVLQQCQRVLQLP